VGGLRICTNFQETFTANAVGNFGRIKNSDSLVGGPTPEGGELSSRMVQSSGCRSTYTSFVRNMGEDWDPPKASNSRQINFSQVGPMYGMKIWISTRYWFYLIFVAVYRLNSGQAVGQSAKKMSDSLHQYLCLVSEGNLWPVLTISSGPMWKKSREWEQCGKCSESHWGGTYQIFKIRGPEKRKMLENEVK